MPYLLGTDEAGYGPNLGPLVISATLWRVPHENCDTDLYELLDGAVARSATAANETPPVVIADSKQLYKPGRGLGCLEQAIFPALSVTGGWPDSWQSCWQMLAPESHDQLAELPWYRGYDQRLPCELESESIERSARVLQAAAGRVGVSLVTVRSTALFPRRLNERIEALGSKGTVLSYATLALVSDLLASLEGEPVYVICDKHGGRDRYGALLQVGFPDHLIEVRRESRQQSTYRWGPPDRRVEIRFQAGGEALLPSALASMTSKYLRELAMRSFNHFWCRHVSTLKPTAGYPVDARRFKADIESTQRKLGINDRVLWRIR